MIISLLILFTLLLVVVVYMTWILNALWGGGDSPTSKNAIRQVSRIIFANNFQNSILYDLGSCRGGFIFGILDLCPDLHAVGIDNSYIRTWTARVRSVFRKHHPEFFKGNIFEADVSKADIIFIYLPRPLLPALEAKLQKDLKPGALVITNRVNLPDWPPSQTFPVDPGNASGDTIFVYRKV